MAFEEQRIKPFGISLVDAAVLVGGAFVLARALGGARPKRAAGRDRRKPAPRPAAPAGRDDLAARVRRAVDADDRDALAAMLRSGEIGVRGRRRNPAKGEPKSLKAARREARNFHGPQGAGEVVELAERERTLPKHLVVLGELPEISYEPDARRSKRGGYRYVHQAGDRGFGRRPSKRRPLLAADPKTGRPVIVPAGSPVRFSSKRGLVG